MQCPAILGFVLRPEPHTGTTRQHRRIVAQCRPPGSPEHRGKCARILASCQYAQGDDETKLSRAPAHTCVGSWRLTWMCGSDGGASMQASESLLIPTWCRVCVVHVLLTRGKRRRCL